MNDQQQNYFRMYLNVQDFLDTYTGRWSAVPRIGTYKSEMDELISRISDKTTEAESKVSVKDRKESLRKALAIKTASISGILQAYFTEQGDMDMAKTIKVSKSDVLTMKEADVSPRISNILSVTREQLSNLTDFGLSEAMITELETTLEDFNPLIGKPRSILNQKYVTLDTIAQLFDETNALLKERMDRIMLMYQDTDEEFYNGYQRARTIVDM